MSLEPLLRVSRVATVLPYNGEVFSLVKTRRCSCFKVSENVMQNNVGSKTQIFSLYRYLEVYVMDWSSCQRHPEAFVCAVDMAKSIKLSQISSH